MEPWISSTTRRSFRCAGAVMVLLAALPGPSQAKARVATLAGSPVGPLSARAIVHVGGQYAVFFATGTGVQVSLSKDGVSFTTPVAATPGLAALGFAVARRDDSTLGLVWGDDAGGMYILRFREAGVDATGLSLGPPVELSSSTDLRGYAPVLTYQGAAPFFGAVEFNRPYSGPFTGCGASARYRTGVYFPNGTGTWAFQPNCGNFGSSRSPVALSLVPAAGNVLLGSCFANFFSTQTAGAAGELDEDFSFSANVGTSATELSSVQSASLDTDVHHVWRDSGGNLQYGRQDGSLIDTKAQTSPLDSLVLSAAGSSPTSPSLSRPTSVAGCHTVVWLEGGALLQRRFGASVASLSPASTSAARQLATLTSPGWVIAEEQSDGPPALLWRDGVELWFEVNAGQGLPALTASPSSIPADAAAQSLVVAGPFHDACGAPLAPGTLVTVAVASGAVVDLDLGALPGVQVATSSGGQVSFSVRAPSSPGPALVTAVPAEGGESAQGLLNFTAWDAGLDAGADAGAPDGGLTDGGQADGGTTDAGDPDGGTTDAGDPDGGAADAGPADGGVTDAGQADGGTTDAGDPDGGITDGGQDGASDGPLSFNPQLGCASTAAHGPWVLLLALLVLANRRRPGAMK